MLVQERLQARYVAAGFLLLFLLLLCTLGFQLVELSHSLLEALNFIVDGLELRFARLQLLLLLYPGALQLFARLFSTLQRVIRAPWLRDQLIDAVLADSVRPLSSLEGARDSVAARLRATRRALLR